MRVHLPAAIGVLAIALLLGSGARAGPDPMVTNYTHPSIMMPGGITGGPDGAVWFTNGDNSSIGRITTSGVVTNYTNINNSVPLGITTGPDGALWFTNFAGSSIGRVTTGGLFTTYYDPGINRPWGIVTGSDGALWFTNLSGNSIGRITTSGVVTTYTGTGIVGPYGIAAGPDGALWFANCGNSSIGRITTAGVVSNYTGAGISYPIGIAAGPDGAMWFTNQGSASIGRITTAGVVTTYTSPGLQAAYAIAAGPDGALWFTSSAAGGSSSIGRITTSGLISIYADPMIKTPFGIAAGPDGAVWFTNRDTNSIGRITTPSAAPGSQVVIGIEQDLPCLNVVLAHCSSSYGNWIVPLALPGAFRQLPDYSYQPMLVDHVDVATSPGFSLTYHLKQQAVWSDAVPVSADDLIFTWQAIMNPAYDIPSRTGYDQIVSAVRVDAKTVRFEFNGPYAPWKGLFPTVLPQHVLAGTDFNTVWNSEIADPATHTPIGAGPYLITNWTKGQGLTLAANPRWWGQHAPYIGSILVKEIFDTNSEIQAMLGGYLDVIYPSPQTALSALLGQAGIATQSSGNGNFEQLNFNVGGPSGMPLLHEQWFRQAVAYSLDRRAIATGVFGAIVPNVPPLQNLLYLSQQPEFRPDFAVYAQDQTRVAALMTAHGCTLGGDGIYVCGGVRASFKLAVTAGNARRALEAATIQAQAKAAGIEVVPDAEPSTVLFGTMLPNGTYDSAIYAWVGNGDPSGFVSIYSCNGSSNYDRYCSADVTSLLQASNAEVDPAARAGLFQQADAIMAQDVPTLPLWQMPDFLAYRTTIHGVVDNTSQQGPFWNAEEWRGPTSTLTVGKTGTGAGSVSSSPAGIDCGPSCSADFDDSTTVVLTAAAAPGSHFDGWQSDCTGTGGCTVVLAGGRSVTAVFTKIVDTTPPVIAVPESVVANATSPHGAVVTYAVAASDPDDAVASLACVPGSGSTFAVGATTVVCTATDSHGNTGSASFTVHVKGATEQLADLAAAVKGIGPGKSLSSTVAVAQWFVAHDRPRAACRTLTAFNLEVRAQSGKKIPAAQAATLIAAAQRIRSVLGC